MKTKILLTTVSAFFILHSAFGQVTLTPPGAPAPTMKSLDQIDAKLDPRTAITNKASCVFGKLKEAEQWLVKAIDLAGKKDIRQMALDDLDLKELWPNLSEI